MDNDLMGMGWMDKRDIWLPQKIASMPGKIPGAATDVFNHREPSKYVSKTLFNVGYSTTEFDL